MTWITFIYLSPENVFPGYIKANYSMEKDVFSIQ